jgi:hypothetical protein
MTSSFPLYTDCTLWIWNLNTLEVINLIELDSAPDGVISLDKYSLALWFEQSRKVEVWSTLPSVKSSQLSLIEFNEQFSGHALEFCEENYEAIASLMCDDFGISVDQGAPTQRLEKSEPRRWVSRKECRQKSDAQSIEVGIT